MENISQKISQKKLGGAERRGKEQGRGRPQEMLRVLGSSEKSKAAMQTPGNPCNPCCPHTGCFTHSIQHVLVTLFMQDTLGVRSEPEGSAHVLVMRGLENRSHEPHLPSPSGAEHIPCASTLPEGLCPFSVCLTVMFSSQHL